MSKCPVCDTEIKNLRKHCAGKWLNNSDDFEHLRLALELSLGASAYLKENLEEVNDAVGDKGRKGFNRDDRIDSLS